MRRLPQAHLHRFPWGIAEGCKIAGCKINRPSDAMPEILEQHGIEPRKVMIYDRHKVGIQVSRRQAQALEDLPLKFLADFFFAKLTHPVNCSADIHVVLLCGCKQRLSKGQAQTRMQW